MNINRNCSKKFEGILLESIDEAFSSLGQGAKTSIYFYLENTLFISKQDIPDKIDDFSHGLEQIFGIGAWHLEVLIMKKLYEKIGCLYKWEGPKWLVPDLTFRKYVELMRISFTDSGKIGNVEVIVDAMEQQEQRA